MAEYAQSWQELEKAFGGRSTLKGSAEEMRTMFNGLMAALAPMYPPPSEAVSTKDGDVEGVRYRIYTPVEAAKGGPLPVGVFAHSGGWVLGSIDSEDPLCRAVAEHARSIIVSVDYRLAPEHKAPAQLEDCTKVYRWAWHNAASYGGDPQKFYSIGGSAGGGLALSIANRIVSNPELRSHIKGVVAMVPVTLHPDHVPTAHQASYKSYAENASGAAVIDGTSMRQFFEYTAVDPRDATYLPALAVENHANFPPTYLATCQFDPLRDDGTVMEASLRQAGVPTRLDHYDGFPHYFWIFPSVPESRTFVEKLVAGTRWVIDQM